MAPNVTQVNPLYNGLMVTREEYLDLEDDGYKYDMFERFGYKKRGYFPVT